MLDPAKMPSGGSGRCRGKKLGPRQVQYDLSFFQAVLNWGVGAGLIERNPLRGFRPTSKGSSPKRPQLCGEHYALLQGVAEEVAPGFPLALVLAHETGHRIGALRLLQWADVNLDDQTIQWRGESDKIGYEHTTPMSSAAVAAVLEARRSRPAIGATWVLGSLQDPSRPVSRHLVRDWWEKAERLAGLVPKKGRGWHSLRRKFATDLKHTPLRDLCELGGWKDPHTVLRCYQQPDQVTMKEALARRAAMA